MYNILVVATYDSFLMSGMKLSERLPSKKIDVCILNIKKNQLSTEQIDKSRANLYNINYIYGYSSNLVNKYDVIILSVGNQASKKFLMQFHMQFKNEKDKRPIVISIFPGVIWGDLDSITSRLNSDILLVNSYYDFLVAKKLAKFYKINNVIFNYGLINIEKDLKLNQRELKKNIVFFDQVKEPESKEERIYILKKLISLANRYPNKNIIIKERVNLTERTVHENKYPYRKLLEKLSFPKNLIFSNAPIEELYTQMDLCLTVSSSVSLEALYYGIPVVIINDLGINPHNYHFIESGLMMSLDEINLDLKFTASEEWKENHLLFASDRDCILEEKIREILRNNEVNKFNMKLLFDEFTLKDRGKHAFFRKLRKFIFSPRLFIRDSKLARRII